MNMQKNLIRQRTEYSRHYVDMGGVDFSGDGSGISKKRFSYLENMYRDWDGDGSASTESIPGFRSLVDIKNKICNIYLQKTADDEYLILCTEKTLYRLPVSKRDDPSALQLLWEANFSKTAGYPFGNEFYILSSQKLYRIDENGGVSSVSDVGATAPYVPITYLSGEAYEQRNLLTKKFKEHYVLTQTKTLFAGSEDLAYTVLDEELATCALTGRGTAFGSVIYVPETVIINQRVYTVVQVNDYAFEKDPNLEKIVLPSTVKKICSYAFARCPLLRTVITGRDLEHIRFFAFFNSPLLSDVYLGKSLKTVEINLFEDCPSLQTVRCEFSESDLESIDGKKYLNVFSLLFDQIETRLCTDIPVFSPAKSIESVTVLGTSLRFGPIYESGHVVAVRVELEDERPFLGECFELSGTFSNENTEADSFLTVEQKAKKNPAYAVLGCTVAEIFDGRIFLAGNPFYPNTVFYSARNRLGTNDPTFFGALNFFNDGMGAFPVGALLAVGNSLAVFKEDDDGSGSIYYHTPTQTGEDLVPKVYPVSYIHTGICAKGEAISFYDDPVFITDNGISALTKAQINLERSVACRSHNVNIRLLSEDLSSLRLAKWRGYLVVMAGENMYLGDSRQIFRHDSGAPEYEWYFLKGIGAYKMDRRVYRYLAEDKDGYVRSDTPDAIANGDIYSETDANGVTHYYVKGTSKEKIAVYATEQRTGGIFYPASAVAVTGDLLFFGTTGGHLCVFNNDKRGVPPESLSSVEGFDLDAYRRFYARRIHPAFYSFAGHAPTYALRTALDNCGIPHLTKNSVKDSLTLKCRSAGAVAMSCEVGTDLGGYRELTSFPGGVFDFCETDFSCFTFVGDEYFTVPIREKEKGWIEKQIGITSREFASPIALVSVSYRYTVKGKIRRH